MKQMQKMAMRIHGRGSGAMKRPGLGDMRLRTSVIIRKRRPPERRTIPVRTWFLFG
jgi:hypothetical protein